MQVKQHADAVAKFTGQFNSLNNVSWKSTSGGGGRGD